MTVFIVKDVITSGVFVVLLVSVDVRVFQDVGLELSPNIGMRFLLNSVHFLLVFFFGIGLIEEVVFFCFKLMHPKQFSQPIQQ